MRRLLLATIASLTLAFAGAARAADPPAPKPDCSAQKTAYDDSVKAGKEAAKVKPDLTSCKEMKGKEKTDCEKPLKDKVKEDVKAAKDKTKEAKMALDCCKTPKKKGCPEAAAAPAPAAPAPPK